MYHLVQLYVGSGIQTQVFMPAHQACYHAHSPQPLSLGCIVSAACVLTLVSQTKQGGRTELKRSRLPVLTDWLQAPSVWDSAGRKRLEHFTRCEALNHENTRDLGKHLVNLVPKAGWAKRQVWNVSHHRSESPWNMFF